MCWRKVVVNLIPLHPHKPSFIQPCPNLWQNSYWLQMDLDRVYVLHDLQDVLAAWTNVHLFHCHLWHLANQLSPEIRQGLTGKCQGETWIVTAGAKHLLSHSLFSGTLPGQDSHVHFSPPRQRVAQTGSCFWGQLEWEEPATAHPCCILPGPHVLWQVVSSVGYLSAF